MAGTVKELLAWARKYVGKSSFPHQGGGGNYNAKNHCQAFVASAYKASGVNKSYTSMNYAYQARSAWGKYKITFKDGKIDYSSIPVGACIYSQCGNDTSGHVSIYSGNGNIIEAGVNPIREININKTLSGRKYYSWGFNGNTKPVGALTSESESYGRTITLPSGLGSKFTFMGWQCITSATSMQYKLREMAGQKFNSEGFGIISNRYVVATTTTFGEVGDLIDVYQSNGNVIKCIIGDIKNQNDNGCSKWGHLNGDCVIEFVVDKSTWYNPMHANPGTSSCHPEWGGKTITKIVNLGNYITGDFVATDGGTQTSFNMQKMSVDNIPDFNRAEKSRILRNWKNTQGMLLKIIHGNVIYEASNLCVDSVQLVTKRRATPAKLTFKIARDVVEAGKIVFEEGDAVALMYNETDMFWGYIFKKQRTKEQIITVTAYDQTRYLKTKETYCYSKTATELIRTICNDYKLQVGTLADTDYMINERVEDNQSLWDIIYNALDMTNIYTGKGYLLYDDFGDITLKSYDDMSADLCVISDTGELIDFDYSTDIDTNTYNRIVLYRDNADTGSRELYISQDSISEIKYGILQYTEKVSDSYSEGQIQSLADRYLDIFNRLNRSFNIEHTGIPELRAGMGVYVQIDDVGEKMYRGCIIESCTHTFKNCEHNMKLQLLCNNENDLIKGV